MITRDTSVNPLANDELVYTIKMSKNMLEHLNETDFQDMELDIDGNSGILKAGDKEFPLLVHPEELDMDVYEMDGSLSKLGHVSQKITPQPSVNSQRIKALTEQEERAKGERRALVIEDKSAKKLKFEKQKKPESDKKRKPTPSKPATLFKPEPELRRKIVHFLATGPKDIKQIAQKVKRQEKDIQLEVLKVATAQISNPSVYQIKDESFKEVMPYQFTDYTEEDRFQVLRNMNLAFEILALPKEAPERLNLLPPEQAALLKQEKQKEQTQKVKVEVKKESVEEDKKREMDEKIALEEMTRLKKEEQEREKMADDMKRSRSQPQTVKKEEQEIKRSKSVTGVRKEVSDSTMQDIQAKIVQQQELYDQIKRLEKLNDQMQLYMETEDEHLLERIKEEYGALLTTPEEHLKRVRQLIQEYHLLQEQLSAMKIH